MFNRKIFELYIIVLQLLLMLSIICNIAILLLSEHFHYFFSGWIKIIKNVYNYIS